jgi:hypothetical protein
MDYEHADDEYLLCALVRVIKVFYKASVIRFLLYDYRKLNNASVNIF